MKNRQRGKNTFDLIEETVHLLRAAPAATLAIYYLGAAPFILGILFFWGDMSRNPFARQHLAEASFGLALLFFWMKFCQAIFARKIRAQIACEPPPQIHFRRALKIFAAQLILQTFGFFILPLALLPLLPFAWAYAFFQNVTALDDGAGAGVLPLAKKAWRQSKLWPRQNIFGLAIFSAFAFYVFLNWTTLCFSLPRIFKMLFGVESVFTQNSWALLNTTFFAAMISLTYLCLDPILKTFYALRCFYGESLQSGEDLRAALKPFAAQKIAAAIFLALAILFSSSAQAADNAPPDPKIAAQIPAGDLDQAINQTIHEKKFTWRMPREQNVENSKDGVVTQFFNSLGEMLRKWMQAVFEWIAKMWRKLFSHPTTHTSGDTSSDYGWIMSVQILFYALIAAALAALAVFLLRVWRKRQKISSPVAAQAMASAPDIADENVRADQLPEDSWIKLARELLARGELRLAMRAFYLASLSHLASRNLISIARFKSNRDYERELRRRAHAFPELLSVFGENVFTFERVWYGAHDVSGDLVSQFSANVEKMKSAG